MIKVIKKAVSYQIECMKCRSIIQFDLADVGLDDRVKCPVCGNLMYACISDPIYDDKDLTQEERFLF